VNGVEQLAGPSLTLGTRSERWRAAVTSDRVRPTSGEVVTRYSQLWVEVTERIRAACSLMRADDPEAAAQVSARLEEWLDHNELELALDELIAGADEAKVTLRRRFWEELLTAALRMQLRPQFSVLTQKIVDLEPYLFDSNEQPLFVYCDFNGALEANLYSLNSIGTALDFARLRRVPDEGLRVRLYDGDGQNDGVPTWLVADATVSEREPWVLVVQAEPDSFRWIRRSRRT
jgi:hypothetical protein